MEERFKISRLLLSLFLIAFGCAFVYALYLFLVVV